MFVAARTRTDLHIRPFSSEVRAWKATARRDNKSLTDWIRGRLGASPPASERVRVVVMEACLRWAAGLIDQATACAIADRAAEQFTVASAQDQRSGA